MQQPKELQWTSKPSFGAYYQQMRDCWGTKGSLCSFQYMPQKKKLNNEAQKIVWKRLLWGNNNPPCYFASLLSWSLPVLFQGTCMLWLPGFGLAVFAVLYSVGNLCALCRYTLCYQATCAFLIQCATCLSLMWFQHHVPDRTVQTVKEHVC